MAPTGPQPLTVLRSFDWSSIAYGLHVLDIGALCCGSEVGFPSAIQVYGAESMQVLVASWAGPENVTLARVPAVTVREI